MTKHNNTASAFHSDHCKNRMAGRLTRLEQIAKVATSPTVVLTRYAALVILIALIAAGSFSPPSASSSSSLSSSGELNPAAAAAQRVMPSKMFVSSVRKTDKAEIATDKNDYAPGEKVIITGSGWKPGETVRLVVHRTSGKRDEVFVAKANSTGRFRNAELLIKESDLRVAFMLTATGTSSKYTAEITFTDGSITIKPAYEGQTNAGGLQTFTLTKQIFTGSTTCSTCGGAPITVTGVNATTGHTFALANTESALISTPVLSEQNGPFGTGWFSPTMSPFTEDPGNNRKICIPGTATGTYVAPFKPGIVTLDNTCTNPKTQFNLGDTICVKVFGNPALQFGCTYFQIHMDDPFSTVRNCSGACNTDTSIRVSMDQGTYTFALPATNGMMGADNRGSWLARVLDCVGNAYGQATFQLHNPIAGQEAADLQVTKSAILPGGPVPPNGTLQYDILVANIGPDPAQTVTFTDSIPTNTTLLSFQQISGPTFTCMAPAVGSTGTITCTIGTLPVGPGAAVAPQTADFRLVVKVDNVPGNNTIFITNTASASSITTETHPANNMSASGTNPVQSSACSLTCPGDITTTANAVCNTPPGSCGPGTVVTFSTATPTGACGAITCSPPSGSCFPVGTTTVNCTENNARCIFQVTVNAAPACTLTCPANITQMNDPNQCGAVVTYNAPTSSAPAPASSAPSAVSSTQPSAPDPGTEAVNIADATCTNPKTSFLLGEVVCIKTTGAWLPVKGAPQDKVQLLDPMGIQRNAPGETITMDPQNFTFTLPSTPTTDLGGGTIVNNIGMWAGRMGRISNGAAASPPAPFMVSAPGGGGCGTITCTPASGSFFPVGTTTVTCTSTAGPSCTFTITVQDTQPPSITCPANITKSNDPNQCGAVVTYPPPTITDNCPGMFTATCVPASGSFFLVGTTTVTCSVNGGAAPSPASGQPAVCTPLTVTQSSSQAITSLSSVSCNAGGIHVENSYYRAFTLSSFGITNQFDIASVDIGVELANAGGTAPTPGKASISANAKGKAFAPGATSQPITVKLYTSSMPFPTGFPGSLTQIGITNTTVNDTSLSVVNIPVTGSAPAGSQLVVEVLTPDGTAGGNSFFIGSNAAAETGPSYVRAPGCGVTTPTTTAAIGFPNMHIVMNVNGCQQVAGGGSSCPFTVTVNDTQLPTITCPPNQTAVTNQNVCPAPACVVVNYPAPVAADNCLGVTVVCNPPAGSCFPTGVTTVTCTATDGSGNTASCPITVSVFDTALEDDSNPATILVWNSITGQYRFCCNGITITGVGKATRQGCVYTLDNTSATDKRVLGRVDKAVHAGSGSFQAPPGTTRCTITDRNTLNDPLMPACQ